MIILREVQITAGLLEQPETTEASGNAFVAAQFHIQGEAAFLIILREVQITAGILNQSEIIELGGNVCFEAQLFR